MSRESMTEKAGDYGQTRTFNLKESEEAGGGASDLTGATAVVIHIRREGYSTLFLTKAGTITNPTQGIVTFQFAQGELDIAGKYYSEIQVTFPTKIVTYDMGVLFVKEQIG